MAGVTTIPTFAIVGLGNYTHPLTKHSIGQLLLESLLTLALSQPGAKGSPHLTLTKSKKAWTSLVSLPSPYLSTPTNLLFIKPYSYMNLSGPPVLSTLPRSFPPSRIITLQDELDIGMSKCRLRQGGSPKGHNGVRSLESSLSSMGLGKEFWRLQIGIGRPEKGASVADWVLSPLGMEEVRACEWEEDGQKGEVVVKAWKEIMNIVGKIERRERRELLGEDGDS